VDVAASDHGFNLHAGSEKKTFPNWEAFLNWKESEEEVSYSYFAQVKGKVDSATASGTGITKF
jgi:hypothetical protein